MNDYQVIYADPPWKYNAWGGAKLTHRPHGKEQYPVPYPTMTISEIKALPVSSLAADNCELYLWTTQKYLPFAFQVIDSWDFKYCQALTWCKKPMGTGQGGLFCPTTEFLLLSRRGKMPKFSRVDSTWWQVKRPHNAHSKKPQFFRELIEAVSNPPRIELFAREKPPGWHVWGNEVDSDVDFNKPKRRPVQAPGRTLVI